MVAEQLIAIRETEKRQKGQADLSQRCMKKEMAARRRTRKERDVVVRCRGLMGCWDGGEMAKRLSNLVWAPGWNVR
jgi:hypothetical protein